MCKITLEPNASRICSIINNYNTSKENIEETINFIEGEVESIKAKELINARNKIYDYFEKIQDALPNDFELIVKLNVSTEMTTDGTTIYFRDNNIVIELPCGLCRYYYHLSRKNKVSKFGSLRDNTVYELEKSYDIIKLVKNWDKIQQKVESEIQKYFESNMNKHIKKTYDNIKDVELLIEFNC